MSGKCLSPAAVEPDRSAAPRSAVSASGFSELPTFDVPPVIPESTVEEQSRSHGGNVSHLRATDVVANAVEVEQEPVPESSPEDLVVVPETSIGHPVDLFRIQPGTGEYREDDDDKRGRDKRQASDVPKDSLALPETGGAFSDEAYFHHGSTAEAEHDGEVGAKTNRETSERTAAFTYVADVLAGLQEGLAVPHKEHPAEEPELNLASVVESVAATNEPSPVPPEPVPQAIECELDGDTLVTDLFRKELPLDSQVHSDALGEAEAARLDELTPRSHVAYTPPAPPPKIQLAAGKRRTRRAHSSAEADLRLRVQLVFGRGRQVKSLALVPDRRNGMPNGVRVVGTDGERHLAELRHDCYEPVLVAEVGELLHKGVEWCGRGEALRWHWLLSGRVLYVLAPGDQFGLHGFVSTPRLSLHARHMILARAEHRDEVLSALAETGCAQPVAYDELTQGLPNGWLLFRDVIPTRAVPMRNEADILNALCPSHEIELHFHGGVRLKRRTWLVGFPPRIKLTGELCDDFRLMIDGQRAQHGADGTIEAPNWDAVGEHRLLFGDKSVTYELRRMEEQWEWWQAHDFGIGAAICGAAIACTDSSCRYQVRVPASNPILVGSREGEIVYCHVRDGVRSDTLLAMVPFAPVWALPCDPARADKRRARVVRLNSAEPVSVTERGTAGGNELSTSNAWVATINAARRKKLQLDDQSKEAKELWRHYCATAKQLWRRAR